MAKTIEVRVECVECALCNLGFVDTDTLEVTPHIYLPVGRYNHTARGVTRVNLYPVCACCAPAHVATLEALAEGARFTPVDCHQTRCACGSLLRRTRTGHDHCVPCGVAHRMLTKAQREQRLMSKLLTTLRKDLKEITKQTKELTT